MAKKIRKRRANYFYDGGFSWDKDAGFEKNMSNAFDSGVLNGAIGAAGSMVGQGISGGLSSGTGNAIQGLGSIASAIPGPWGAVAGAGLNIVGGLVNKAFGSQINKQAVQEAKAANTQQSNMRFAASNTTDLLNQSDFGLLNSVSKSAIGKDGWFSNKAKRLTNEVNRQRDFANQLAIANFGLAADNLDEQNNLNTLANYAAYGGPLTMRYTGTMSPFGNTFADGGNIHIKPENRGKFTRLKKRTGKSSTWYKEHGTPEQKKMATFALNARKWKHAFGGSLLTNGAEWNNGLTVVGNGGTHEENPMEGVQMGMDAQGVPNLVEEGEVIFNDYVFSNRMRVPKAVRSKYKLRDSKGITFADAAKKIAKESEERPNDPISQRGLDVMLGELASIQEDERFKNQMKDPEFRQQAMNQLAMQGQQYAQGGLLGRKYDGLGEVPNVLETPDQTDPYAFSDETKRYPTWMRYAPIAAAGAGVFTDALGWTNKPDYSNANAILDATANGGNYMPVSAASLGDYLTYNPLDRNYYTNKLNAQSGAARRAIVNQSAGNRAAALAGLVASDYNAQSRLGDFVRQAEEYNQGQRERVTAFNRGTNQANAEMGLKAAMANQSAFANLRDYRLKGTLAAAQMRENAKRLADANRSANLTNFVQGLGDIGSENVGWNQMQWAVEHGVFGPMQDRISKGYRRKNGGKLLTKRR